MLHLIDKSPGISKNQNLKDRVLQDVYNRKIKDLKRMQQTVSSKYFIKIFPMFNIQLLLDEREHVQKKTFTKWVNSHLMRINCRVNDLYTDLRDGKLLIKLLEILSGERLVSIFELDINKPKMAYSRDLAVMDCHG